MTSVRTRVAPSPTGFFHIGNAKTALYNWLFARKNGGTFILRLEDTDVERSREEYAVILGEAMHWLGLDWDEGPGFEGRPDVGGFGPYRQSQRKDLYLREAHRLLEEGKAYKCFATVEEIEAERELARAEKRAAHRSKWRTATPEEVAAMGDAPYAIRFRVPEDQETLIPDLLQGDVVVNNREVDDFVLVRPNGDPVFHLAVVVDDGLMKITHVIRGDDHLTNAAKHVLLFNALGYDLPKFVHHPLVHDEQGKKYSKRLHGANVLDWRRDGYLPETIINYLALLGWGAKDDRELFTPQELIEAFSLEGLNLSPGRFDFKKVLWLNGQHIRLLSAPELRKRLTPVLVEAGFDLSGKSEEWLDRMAAICQEKIATLNDIVVFTDFFFAAPTDYDEKAVDKHWRKPDAADRLRDLLKLMADVPEWTLPALHAAYEKEAERTGAGLGKLVHPTRLALTGKSVGPGLFELTELLGKEESLTRMKRALEYVENLGEKTT